MGPQILCASLLDTLCFSGDPLELQAQRIFYRFAKKIAYEFLNNEKLSITLLTVVFVSNNKSLRKLLLHQ